MPCKITLHREGFSGRGLTVGENGTIPALEDAVDDWFGDGVEHLYLSGVGVENVVEIENEGLFVLTEGGLFRQPVSQ